MLSSCPSFSSNSLTLGCSGDDRDLDSTTVLQAPNNVALSFLGWSVATVARGYGIVETCDSQPDRQALETSLSYHVVTLRGTRSYYTVAVSIRYRGWFQQFALDVEDQNRTKTTVYQPSYTNRAIRTPTLCHLYPFLNARICLYSSIQILSHLRTVLNISSER